MIMHDKQWIPRVILEVLMALTFTRDVSGRSPMIFDDVASRMKTCELWALITSEHWCNENTDENRCWTLEIIGDFGKSMKTGGFWALITGEHWCNKNTSENRCGTLEIMDIHGWFWKIDENMWNMSDFTEDHWWIFLKVFTDENSVSS
jgi:hypothetical protein